MAEKKPVGIEYEAAVEELKKFCEENTEFDVCIDDARYPFRVRYLPSAQLNVFDEENVDENGVVNELIVTVGISTKVNSTLRFRMDAGLLKKLIKRAERLGEIYYHAFREAADPDEEE